MGPARQSAQPGSPSPAARGLVDPVARGQVERTDTHCPYCALQCGLTLVRKGGRLEVEGRDFAVNRGNLCRKGWTSAELLDAPDRLLSPLLRPHRGAPLAPVSWDE